MIKLNFNNIEIVKVYRESSSGVHFQHYFAKYNGKTIEGTRHHSEGGSRVQAKKTLKENAILENGIYYVD